MEKKREAVMEDLDYQQLFNNLSLVEEDEDEEEEEEYDDIENENPSQSASTSFNVKPNIQKINIRDEDIPQAFSHYTHRKSKRKDLVCDLQGVLAYKTNGRKVFEMTDPVIHYKPKKGSLKINNLSAAVIGLNGEATISEQKDHEFGRTDHGSQGQSDFFDTHQCSELCQFINKNWVFLEN